MFLKEKRDRSIKARGCADGRPQRIYTNKEDASSPTMSIEAMVLSCVANKKIAGKQCMILWHVDDLKISHVDKAVVEDILKKLNTKFGQESPLTTSRGKVLDYLGMKIDYRQKGKVKFIMYEYMKRC